MFESAATKSTAGIDIENLDHKSFNDYNTEAQAFSAMAGTLLKEDVYSPVSVEDEAAAASGAQAVESPAADAAKLDSHHVDKTGNVGLPSSGSCVPTLRELVLNALRSEATDSNLAQIDSACEASQPAKKLKTEAAQTSSQPTASQNTKTEVELDSKASELTPAQKEKEEPAQAAAAASTKPSSSSAPSSTERAMSAMSIGRNNLRRQAAELGISRKEMDRRLGLRRGRGGPWWDQDYHKYWKAPR